MNEYAILKLIHLGALIFWLGPAFGAWLVLKAVDKHPIENNPVAASVSKIFYLCISLEHIAFLVLLTTGATLAYRYQLFGVDWLNQRLYIVFLLVIPLEIVDIILGNWIASKASKKLHAGRDIQGWEKLGLEIYHGIFTKIALVIVPTSVLLIMYLATSKTTIAISISAI